jgi:hypothetical protein
MEIKQGGTAMSNTKMTQILLPRGRKNEENFVIVSVNGKSWKIMKGVEVSVPVYVAEVLENGRRMAEEARRYVDKMAE